jgi:hypothetical protein
MSKKYEFVKDEYRQEVELKDKKLSRLQNAAVDFTQEYKMPEFVIKIKTGSKWANIGSLGNFSCITGQAKARKSFARFFLEAAAVKNGMLSDTFYVKLPEGKRDIIYIDTEQGKDNVKFAGQRIMKMAGINNPVNYKAYAFREYSYLERCEMIEEIIINNPELGILFLDGVADLASCNNDEVEGNRVAQLLMTWTSRYNIHINTIIHQPRSHGGATGHLGAVVEKKGESIIGVKKDGDYSIIESKMLRNSADFSPFPFIINSDYIPELIGEKHDLNDTAQIFNEDNEFDEAPF